MSVSSNRPERSVACDAAGGARVWLAAAVVVVLSLAAYHNSFSVPFVFDDVPSILENPALRDPWRVSSILGPAQAGGLTTSGRPLVHLSLALNYALTGNGVWSYHLANLLIHVGAGLCLFGLARRTLTTPVLGPRFGPAALPLALAVAALWTLHPLQTESVTYVVQRAEALAGFFYLLALYAFIRSTDSARPRWWIALVVVACLLGVMSKEIVVSAPLVVFFYDRTFVSGTFRGAWRRHRGLYLMLGATWVVLALLITGTGSRGGTAGFATDMSSWSYALTQCRAIVRYLGLTLWPDPLVFDYGLATDRHLADVLPQALFLVTLVTGVVVALRRWPVPGFAGISFLALLAPSSSFVPVVTQTMAEHRMYLPLAAVIAVVVSAVYRILGSRALWWSGAVAIACAVATVGRNHDYQSDEAIWRDTALKLPTNARAHNNLGQAVFRVGKIDESIACYDRALRLQPNYPESHYNLGVALARLDRLPVAIEHYEEALRQRPAYPEAHNNLGNALVKAGRVPEAIRHYELALAAKPDFAEAHNNLGNALLQSARVREAEACFKRALELKPDYAEANYNLGNAYAATGAMKDALVRYLDALKMKPNYAEAHVNAGNALLALERPAEAILHYERAVTLTPELADAHYNFASALLDLGRWSEAIPRLETVLRLNPDYFRADRALGFALAQSGRAADAIPHYERYVRAVPGDAEAGDELRQLRVRR